MLMGAQASTFTDHAFVFYGLPDGEYELVAQQFSQTRDVRASEPKRIKVQGADITGVNLTVAPLPAITGRVILDSSSPADCVKRRATAFQETVVSVRRQKRPAKSGAPEEALADAVPLSSLEQIAEDVPDAKGDFILRNLRAGIYRVERATSKCRVVLAVGDARRKHEGDRLESNQRWRQREAIGVGADLNDQRRRCRHSRPHNCRRRTAITGANHCLSRSGRERERDESAQVFRSARGK